jgi:glutamyl-tRNA synthetase
MNAQTMKSLPDERLLEAVNPFAVQAGAATERFFKENRMYCIQCLNLMRERMKKVSDFMVQGRYFFEDPVSYDNQAMQKYWVKDDVTGHLLTLISILQNVPLWNAVQIEESIRNLIEKLGVGLGELVHPVRLALTGVSASPGIFELMEVLGRERVLKRLRTALDYIKKN